jgi:hypothetical protein
VSGQPSAYCYCNTHQHSRVEHPKADCIAQGCECKRMTALAPAAQAVLEAAVTWANDYEQGNKGEIAARLKALDAIRRYRDTVA